MKLLELKDVCYRARQGAQMRDVLCEVSLQVDGGELVAVLGARRSGRSTLLRIAAGIDAPHAGSVVFGGRELHRRRRSALGTGIGYCQTPLRSSEAHGVLDELLIGQLARGVPQSAARRQAREALERTAAEHCAVRSLHELDAAEAVRVAIARALVLDPSLLVVDEPTKGVDLLERDALLGMLRSLADEGIAVLMSAGDATALSGADRALSLTGGRLRGSLAPELAAVVPLRRQALA